MHKISITSPPPSERIPATPWAFIWFFLRPARWALLLIFVLEATATVLMSLAPLFYREITMRFTEGRVTDADILPLFAWMVLVLFVVQPILTRTAGYLGWPVFLSHLRETTRHSMAIHARRHDLDFFQRGHAGRIAAKVKEGGYAIAEMASISVFIFAGFLVSLVTTCILLLGVDIMLAGIFLLWTAAYIILMRRQIPRVAEAATRNADANSHVSGILVDVLSNIRLVKSLADESHENDIMRVRNHEALRASRRMHALNQMMWVKLSLLTLLLVVPVLSLTAYNLQRGTMSAGDAVMTVTLLPQFIALAWSCSDFSRSFFECLSNAMDTMRTLTVPITISDQPEATVLPREAGDVELRDVSFSYGNIPVLDCLSLTVPAGQRLGVTGPSGVGKSTLLDLVPRLRDVMSGAVLVNGHDVRDVTMASLRDCVGMVSQQASLLHRSVCENVKYGRPGASDIEMEQAARLAGAHEFITGLTDDMGRCGYDAYVGERGVALSGGQRQRLSIACAILKDAPVLLLDEATSALDGESEALVQDGLLAAMRGKTVIVVAHRLSTLARMDRIVVLVGGRIVEDGTPAELLRAGGHYAEMWARHAGRVDAETADVSEG